MLKIRIIPILLLKNNGLVKGVQFKQHQYVGDPLNAVKIFSEKEVPELIFLDITATDGNRIISVELIQNIADECYMPFIVGGGIHDIETIRKILYNGAEKVTLNTASVENPELIQKASDIFGRQSILVSIDVRKKLLGGYEVVTHSGKKPTGLDPISHAKEVENLGAGEILICSTNNEGTMKGFDVELVRKISDTVNIPVIATGGAGIMSDFDQAVINGHASAVAAGSMFVFHGRRKAVLINYPSIEELREFQSNAHCY